MADIWLWRDGDDPTTGGPIAQLSLADCMVKLGVRPHHYCGDLSTPPRFERCEDPLPTGIQIDLGSPSLRGYQHVIMRLDEIEAKADEWKPGFYRCPVSPEEAYALLQESL
jgi:hypothetical protein